MIETIDCHLETDGDMPPMTAIAHANGTISATYADGTTVAVPLDGPDGAMVLARTAGDEPRLAVSQVPLATPTPAAAVLAAFGAWIATPVSALDDQGEARTLETVAGGIALTDSDGARGVLAAVEEGRPLRAVWDGEALLGFGYDTGTTLATADGVLLDAEVSRVQARLAVMRSLTAGEWRIVAGEGEGLGTDPAGVVRDAVVKLGFQPVHPAPGEPHAEWMWAHVVGIDGEAVTGRMASEPAMLDIALAWGDEIRFERRDVYAVAAT